MNQDQVSVEFISRHPKDAQLFWMPEGGGEPTLAEGNWLAGSRITHNTYPGHRFQAREQGSGKILMDFTISHANRVYVLPAPEAAPAHAGGEL